MFDIFCVMDFETHSNLIISKLDYEDELSEGRNLEKKIN